MPAKKKTKKIEHANASVTNAIDDSENEIEMCAVSASAITTQTVGTSELPAQSGGSEEHDDDKRVCVVSESDDDGED